MREQTRRRLAVLTVFTIVTCLDAAVLWRTRDRHLGVHEDHFDKGVSLYQTGSMALGSRPMVFRPPGYPVFVATALAARDALTRPWQSASVDGTPRGGRRVTVLVAHAVLLGVLGAAIVWFAIGSTGTALAVSAALAVACNPLLLLLAGHVSYELLHLVILTLATLMLVRYARADPKRDRTLFANGLVWGMATLVKSVTLIAPVFILAWLLGRGDWRKAAVRTAIFTAGLLIVIAPYTARNFLVSGRFIPVNQQASFALWATSLERIRPGDNYQQWVRIWFASAMPTYTEVTGASDYSPALFEDHVLVLSDRFGAMAADNLRRDPTIYLYNAVHNAVMFLAGSPASFFFERYQWPMMPRASRMIAGLSLSVIAVVGVAAAIAGCVRRDPQWTLVLALFSMMWVAHALTFLEPRYLYVKLPTLIVAFVLACREASSPDAARWRARSLAAVPLAAVLSIVALLLL